MLKRWVAGWMKRIRWTEHGAGRNVWKFAKDVNIAPFCWCGGVMQARAGYEMGGPSDWVAYACPRERPWNFWRHSPWTTVRKDGK